MELSDRIYVAGHTGLIGSALYRELKRRGYKNIITRPRQELDLLDSAAVRKFFGSERPDFVFLSAGKTGGVYANDTYRADFIYENLQLQNNVIHAAFLAETQKLLYFGCSSMYPKECPQPMHEEALLSGALEPTSEPFAVAKLAGIKLCESYNRQYGTEFISVVPTNIYGIKQNYTPLNSLVIPSLIRRFHEAKVNFESKAVVWGSGRPSRDFLYVEDLADACIFLMQHYSEDLPINVGSGRDITISEAAEIIRKVVGFSGELVFDNTKPDGVLRKLQDISRIKALGWSPEISFEEGILHSYQDFVASVA
jgi:GDP-L-fucose synthase